MGLFCISIEKTPEAQLDCALGNLELFRGMLSRFGDIRDSYGNRMPDYLLDFVESQIKDSLKLIENSKDMSINKSPTTHG